MADYDHRRSSPNYAANDSFNRRMSQRGNSPAEMSFTEHHSSAYSKRHNEEAIRAMADGAEEEEAGLKAIPFKVVMLGDVSVGKTCIVQRYIYNQYEIQQNTLSANFASKTLVVDPPGQFHKTKVKL